MSSNAPDKPTIALHVQVIDGKMVYPARHEVRPAEAKIRHGLIEFAYKLPTIPITLKFNAENKLIKRVDIATPSKIETFKNYCSRFHDNLDPMPFNLWDIIEIPTKSLISPGDIINLVYIFRYFYFPSKPLPDIEAIRAAGIVGVPELFSYELRKVNGMLYKSAYTGSTTSSGFDTIFLDYGEPVHTLINSSNYKIHFLPKNEYFLYTILKLDLILNNLASKLNRKLMFKFRPFSGYNRRPYESFVRDMNGGVSVGTIVIYASDDLSITATMLTDLLEAFKGQEDLLGDMNIQSSEEIPPFNIRLNPLIAYTARDRGQTIDIMERMRNGKSVNANFNPKFEIPAWLKDAQKEKCSENEEELNKNTQVLLGIDVCKDKAPINLDESCKSFNMDKKFCFMQKGFPTLKPFPFYKDYKNRKTSGGKKKSKNTRKTRGRPRRGSPL